MRAIGILMLCVMISPQAFPQHVKKVKRYTNHTELGILTGRTKYDFGSGSNRVDSKFSLSAQMFNGVKLNDYLSAGITVGMDWYKTALVTPIAAGGRYVITKRGPGRLFAALDAGYGATWLHQDSDGYHTKGGFMLNPGIGLTYGKPGGAAFTISLSYKRQEIIVNKPLLWEQTYRKEERVYNRLALKLGMAF
ncbi:hypothetical protein [Dyadobacter sp. 32]|uniref:hypothetical protein n=1 Tax=Dyadobacter sp. 32 TaxID=538966 RepID=UPI0011EE65E3